jgi:hypothetical protein
MLPALLILIKQIHILLLVRFTVNSALGQLERGLKTRARKTIGQLSNTNQQARKIQASLVEGAQAVFKHSLQHF